MALRIYNTLTKDKVNFTTITPNEVKMYVCGPTVYDYLHIGNFRGAIFFNLVRNWLEESGYKVTFVYNYTDVDDKIINRANDEGVDSLEISEKFITAFEEDFSRLGLKKHDHNPKVTDYIPQIIELVESIIERENAYVVDGEVFYSIEKFPTYGDLSGKKLEDLNAGERVDVDKRKRNPADFVLWKPAKPGEPSWDSPWGKGRPGWHIECSAMIKAILGNSIDIHGGGIDLIFPHHENEIAQGEGATGEKYCNCWMHNNFINLSGEKMSKSLGNVFKARDFMNKYHPEILKMVMLSVHYRSPLDITPEKIEQSISGLARVYKALKDASSFQENNDEPFKQLKTTMETAEARIKKALNDDFNTGEAMAQIFEVVRTFNAQNVLKKAKDPKAAASATAFKNFITKWGGMFALYQAEPTTLLKELDEVLIREKNIDVNLVQQLIDQRNNARAEKDWAKSDEARDKLLAMGIEIFDTPDGTSWEMKK